VATGSYSEEQLVGMASILADEGYGSFERALMAIRALRGDIKRTRNILSTLMITEA